MKPARGSAASPRPPAVWPLLPAPQASSQLCGWPAGDLSQGPLPQCSHLFQRWADGLSVPTAPWGLTLFQPHTRGSGLSGGTAAGPKELAGGRGALLKGREWGSASHCAAIPAVPSVSQGPSPSLGGLVSSCPAHPRGGGSLVSASGPRGPVQSLYHFQGGAQPGGAPGGSGSEGLWGQRKPHRVRLLAGALVAPLDIMGPWRSHSRIRHPLGSARSRGPCRCFRASAESGGPWRQAQREWPPSSGPQSGRDSLWTGGGSGRAAGAHWW